MIWDVATREFIYLWYYSDLLFRQIAPYWAVGILVGSIISVFGKSKLEQLLSLVKDRPIGLLGIVPASVLGIASPICMYGTIPLVASLSKRGLRQDWLAAFMMSSILLNPQLLLYSGALGLVGFSMRLVLSILGGILAGLVIWLFYRDKKFFDFSGFDARRENRDVDHNMFWRLLKNIGRNIKITGPYFLVGIFLAALFQRYIPADLFLGLFGNQRGLGVLLAATLGVPMYVCGGGTIPILVEWLRYGMSMGAAAAFMISGPATKFTNLGALKIVLGIKHFIYYLAFVIVYAIVSGVVINLFI